MAPSMTEHNSMPSSIGASNSNTASVRAVTHQYGDEPMAVYRELSPKKHKSVSKPVDGSHRLQRVEHISVVPVNGTTAVSESFNSLNMHPNHVNEVRTLLRHLLSELHEKKAAWVPTCEKTSERVVTMFNVASSWWRLHYSSWTRAISKPAWKVLTRADLSSLLAAPVRGLVWLFPNDKSNRAGITPARTTALVHCRTCQQATEDDGREFYDELLVVLTFLQLI